MPDRQQSTDRPQPGVSEVFRESFVTVFERPEHEAALRVVGAVAHDLVCEGRRLILSNSEADSLTRAAVRGAVGDLRQAADQLAEVSRDLDEAGSHRETVRVMLAIADAAVEVAPIAARLDAALDAYLAAREAAT